MEDSSAIDLAQLAKHLKLDAASLQSTVELLEEGNTVPFITRFRKDQTGGLDEQQIRTVQRELSRQKQLRERKESILKSIESRQQLTPELQKRIQTAKTMRVLEDLYLPYKPKKKSLAYVARSRGLGPLADEILQAATGSAPLEEAAAKLIDAEKELPDAEVVLSGVQHLLAEHFCNDSELRSLLRRHMWQHGQLVSKKIDDPVEAENASRDEKVAADASSAAAEAAADETATDDTAPAADSPEERPSAAESGAAESGAVAGEALAGDVTESPPGEQNPSSVDPSADANGQKATSVQSEPAAEVQVVDAPQDQPPSEVSEVAASSNDADAHASATDAAPVVAVEAAQESGEMQTQTVASVTVAVETTAPVESETKQSSAASHSAATKTESAAEIREKKKAAAREQRRATRRRRRERLVQSFKDYFDFKDPLGRLPHHRILAINRGERTKVLRVKIECGHWDKLLQQLRSKAFDAAHPHAEFLDVCLQDAVSRLLVPSIEREVRRELNERAEEHAVKVFAKNLRKLLLQPPLSGHRVIAIDPGFRSGCKVVALDEFGKLLGHTFINLLGKNQQREQGRAELAKFVGEHKATVIAVGNGAACRETETLVGDLLANELKDEDVGYLIVNEAGTSVYSTSELGREELPDVDPTVRSAVSIGRRALDPLSELVKVDPASIGVGLYQHDVKAKHLRESLDDVVESCVNYVGVDVNSASPSLLRYVSGLNKMTANQIYKHREQHGPFNSREELKAVSGVGDSSYVQAAGFLKIKNGENCLDRTWIHPESYAVAERVLAAIGFDAGDLPLIRAASLDVPTLHESTAWAATDAARPVEGDVAPHQADANDAVAQAAEAPSETRASDAADEGAPASSVESAETAAEVPVAEAPAAEAPTSDAVAPEASLAEAARPESPHPEVADPESSSSESKAPPGVRTAADPLTVSSAKEEQPRHTSAAAARTEHLVQLRAKLDAVDVSRLAPQLGVGKLLLQDILTALARPGRDPREDVPSPPFRKGVLKLEDLKPDMELSGTVLNVVDFGAFVDIGLVDSGLIHVSRLADKYVADPHEVVSVGDILRVWVVEVDNSRRRVSLTAIEPGTERPKRERPPRESREPRSKQQNTQGGKKRREDRRGQGKRGGGHKSKEFRSKAKPKPFVPISKEMEEGTEPMRTFGDLKQLFDKKKNKGK